MKKILNGVCVELSLAELKEIEKIAIESPKALPTAEERIAELERQNEELTLMMAELLGGTL